MNKTRALVALLLTALLLPAPLAAQTGEARAPGAPGKDAQWLSAGKHGVGTSASLDSKVWFTLHGGALTEVYYPDVTIGNVEKLELVVAHQEFPTVQTETRDTVSRVVPDADSLTFTQINTAKNGEYRIEKRYTVDPQRSVLLIDIKFTGNLKRRMDGYDLYVNYDPSLNNSGMHDTAFTENGALLASDGDKASALVTASGPWREGVRGGFTSTTNGFAGVSDGLTLMERARPHAFPPAFDSYARAEKGNVVQLGKLPTPSLAPSTYTVALGFAKTPAEALSDARASLRKGFAAVEAEYRRGWQDYVKTLPQVGAKYQAQFNMAAMILKAHEDKLHRGANIASLSVPWGGGSNANEANVGGYHLVWSRDLYQVATAYMALGDKAAAVRALDFLFKVQQKPDGSFPQNSWLDGRPYWGSLQHDEVAFPLILAHQLGQTDRETYTRHVR
ncbi:MAG TPA: glycoside hydrolase family 15 protein, partial [Pyrinomonadaceae bacterium]